MTGLLEGKNFLVTGAANSRSIAWSVALAIRRHGGNVALTYQAERLKRRVGALAAKRGGAKRGSSVIVGPEGDPNDLVRAFVGLTRVFLMPTLADVMRGARYQLTREDGG